MMSLVFLCHKLDLSGPHIRLKSLLKSIGTTIFSVNFTALVILG